MLKEALKIGKYMITATRFLNCYIYYHYNKYENNSVHNVHKAY